MHLKITNVMYKSENSNYYPDGNLYIMNSITRTTIEIFIYNFSNIKLVTKVTFKLSTIVNFHLCTIKLK